MAKRKKIIGYRHRDSVKGHYVSEAYAAANPTTTTREAIYEDQ
jgi:hypothetical protein